MRLYVGVGSWIIQDGNDPDFASGERHRFALEFYSKAGFKPADPEKSLTRIVGANYHARGIIVHADADAWVCDFGVLAYRDESPPSWARPGVGVVGDVYLGIDHFAYKETLRRRPHFPRL